MKRRGRHLAPRPKGREARLFGRAVPLALAFTLLAASVAMGAVSTDQADYAPGSVVTISGNNSNDAGYLPGETVGVDVQGPNGYTASCEGVADDAGAWSCQVTLWDTYLAWGEYSYTATGQISGVSETGTFTDALNTGSFELDCTTAQETFTSGSTVCIKLTGLGNDASGTINWWKPGLNPESDTPTRSTSYGDKDGQTTDSLQVSDCGTWYVRVTASAVTGGPSDFDDTFSVNGCAPANSAPIVTANDDSFDEGTSKEYSASWSDADSDQTHTCTIDFGDGSGAVAGTVAPDQPSTSGTCSANHTYADGLNSYTIQVSVSDDTDQGSDSATATVSNVAPTVDADFTGAADCQINATLSIDPDDLGVNDSPWKVNINWGDGNTEPEISRTDLDSFTVTHVYALAGLYNATVTVTDKDGATGFDLDNPVTINQTYTVDFLPPFDDSTPSGLIVNKMKNGRVVPVKVTLYDDCGQATVTDPDTDVTIKVSKTSGTGGTADLVETYADAGESSAGTDEFRWSGDSFWIYNLDSKAMGLVVNNYYRVDVYVDGVKATVDNWAVLQPVK